MLSGYFRNWVCGCVLEMDYICELSLDHSSLEEAVGRARQSKIFAERLALVVLAKDFTLLEFWNNSVYEIGRETRSDEQCGRVRHTSLKQWLPAR